MSEYILMTEADLFIMVTLATVFTIGYELWT
jgi:hypothetical protein